MISQVQTDMVTQKETVLKETMLQVNEIVKSSQTQTIEQAKQLSMSEMMKAIEEHKGEVRKQMDKTVSIMKQGIKKSQEEQKLNKEKMAKRMAAIEKKMESGDEAAA